jgi:L-serine dehydratase
MFLSTFDIFKIGIGPSSSHTMGPMIAAARFLDELRDSSGSPVRLAASLHGSLAFTGKGHATDRAVILGLLGSRPETLNPDDAGRLEAELRATGRIQVPGLGELIFEPERDLVFDYDPPLPGHAMGQGLPIIGKLLGHSQLQTTARYAHFAADPVIEVADLISERLARSLDVNGNDEKTSRAPGVQNRPYLPRVA